MFEDVNAEVNRRLKEVKSFYSLIKDNAETEVLDMRVFKGTYFVILYGVLEYTITASVQKCLSIINQKKYDIIDLKPTLYSMVFNDECNASMLGIMFLFFQIVLLLNLSDSESTQQVMYLMKMVRKEPMMMLSLTS